MNLNLGLGGGNNGRVAGGHLAGSPAVPPPYLSPVGTIPWGESPLP